jgi:hypothetical protein
MRLQRDSTWEADLEDGVLQQHISSAEARTISRLSELTVRGCEVTSAAGSGFRSGGLSHGSPQLSMAIEAATSCSGPRQPCFTCTTVPIVEVDMAQ